MQREQGKIWFTEFWFSLDLVNAIIDFVFLLEEQMNLLKLWFITL